MNRHEVIGLGLLLVYLAGLAVAGIQRPAWGDESHFVETARLFGEQFGWTTLTHYEEMSTPFPFMLYGLWGSVFEFELGTLRILSLLIAGGTYVSFYRLARRVGGAGYQPLALTALLAMNPYMIGLSLFVFPDMLTIGFAILVVQAMLVDRPVLAGLANALGLLSKQYFLFVTLASCIVLAFRYYKTRDKAALRAGGWMGLSMVPTLALFMLWGGVSPDNAMKARYVSEAFVFHADFVSLYLALFFVYPAPLILYRWRLFYRRPHVWPVALLLASGYWLAPIRAADPAVAGGVHTVGLLHRGLLGIFSAPIVDLFFYGCIVLAIPVVMGIARDGWMRMKRPDFDGTILLHLTILCFFLVMPLSYLNWEKYFLPVLPAVLLALMFMGSSKENHDQKGE